MEHRKLERTLHSRISNSAFRVPLYTQVIRPWPLGHWASTRSNPFPPVPVSTPKQGAGNPCRSPHWALTRLAVMPAGPPLVIISRLSAACRAVHGVISRHSGRSPFTLRIPSFAVSCKQRSFSRYSRMHGRNRM